MVKSIAMILTALVELPGQFYRAVEYYQQWKMNRQISKTSRELYRREIADKVKAKIDKDKDVIEKKVLDAGIEDIEKHFKNET